MHQIIAGIHDIHNNNFKRAISEGLQKIKFRNIIKNDDTVLIKPNFTWFKYKEGVTTNPLLLKHLTSILKNNCKRLIIAESDGANNSWSALDCFKGHNLYKLARINGFELINLTEKAYCFKRVFIKEKFIDLKVSKFILDKVDKIISVPVLKNHIATEVSLGLKNLWGLLPDPFRLLYHHRLHEGIVALNKIYNPCISIIDASYGLIGNGPIGGIPVKINKILISNNITALDILACNFMGIPYEKVKHIKIAKDLFLPHINLDQINKYGNFESILKFKMYRNFFDKITVFIMFHEKLNRLFYRTPLSGCFQKLTSFYKALFKKKSLY